MRALVFALFIGIGGISALTAAREPPAQLGGGQATIPAAVRAANSRFAGVWKLVGEDTRDANGQTVARGPNTGDAGNTGRFGYIVYDPAGYMSVNLAWLKQQSLAGGKATNPQEALAAMGAYNSYWGSFAVNEARGVVTHQTFGALSPAFAGTNQERHFTFSGNRLTLQPPASANGDQRTLTWERVPDLPDLTPTHRKLIGLWKLISLERRNAKGDVLSSYPGWTGFIVYTASGHVMVHMMQPYRRRNVGPSPTPGETMATYRGYTSYFGPYTVNESEKYVVHHLAAAINSGAAGTDFQRFVEFSGKRLTLKPPVTKDSNGGSVQTTITWERLSD
jgi:hypothetical protein